MSADPTLAENGVMPGDGQSTREIVRRTEQAVQVMPLMSDDEIRRAWRVAQALAASRMFKDTVQAEQAFAKILIGRDLGLSPTRAMMTLDLVKGNIQMRGVLLASFVRQHPDYDYELTEHTNERAVVVISRRGRDGEWRALPPEEFTIEDAKRARLVKEDGAYTTFPKNMLVWRALSNAVKFHAPELTAGMPVYVEGELDQVAELPKRAAGAQEIPARLAELLARARAVDVTAWRQNEVLARLPGPEAHDYEAAVDAIVEEITAWLAEHEPTDAQVVTDGENSEPGETLDEHAVGDPAAGWDDGVRDGLEERYRTDEAWRLKVDVLLNRQADLEAMLEDAVSGGEEGRAAEHAAELESVEGDLDVLGVPLGWHPSSDEQTSLGL